MIRSAGNIERACELVGAALIWGHDVHVSIVAPLKGGRPTYAVHTVPRGQEGDET